MIGHYGVPAPVISLWCFLSIHSLDSDVCQSGREELFPSLVERCLISFHNLHTKFFCIMLGNLKKIQHGNQNQWGILCDALGKYELSFSIKRSTYFGGLTLKWWKCSATFPISEPYDKIECNCRKADQQYQRINFGSQLIKSSCKCVKVFGLTTIEFQMKVLWR